MPIKAHS